MKINYHKTFKKQYKKLPLKIQQQVDKRLLIFDRDQYNKQLNNHSIDGAYPDCRSINITGNYRALYRRQGEGVLFVLIGTHSELY